MLFRSLLGIWNGSLYPWISFFTFIFTSIWFLLLLGLLNRRLKSFDVLLWWKLNAHRYPVISKMAKNFLTIPATSVSSESTFSTGGRVLDDYRSSLKPAIVEALVCASSWIKGSHNDNKVSVDVVCGIAVNDLFLDGILYACVT